MFQGLSNLANIGSIIKQAQQMGSKLQEVSDQLKTRRVQGSAGGGMVTVEANGLGEVLSCRIEPSVFSSGDREMVEDLLPAAINQALVKAKQLHAEAMQSITAGMDMPGLNDALGRILGSEKDSAT